MFTSSTVFLAVLPANKSLRFYHALDIGSGVLSKRRLTLTPSLEVGNKSILEEGVCVPASVIQSVRSLNCACQMSVAPVPVQRKTWLVSSG